MSGTLLNTIKWNTDHFNAPKAVVLEIKYVYICTLVFFSNSYQICTGKGQHVHSTYTLILRICCLPTNAIDFVILCKRKP